MDNEHFSGVAHALASDKRPFGERLRYWREQRQLSVEIVGKVLGVTGMMVSRWESGASTPPDEGELVKRLSASQDKAGENPGTDTPGWAAQVWRDYLEVAPD